MLLAAAEQVFAQRGYGRASIRDIAAAAGFSVGGVYQFFTSKDELFLAVTESLQKDYVEATAGVAALDGFETQLLELTRASLAFFGPRHAFLVTLITERGSFSGTFRDRVAKAVDGLKRARREQVIEVLHAGEVEGRLRVTDLDALASAYLGVINQCHLDVHHGFAPVVPAAGLLVSLFLHGAAHTHARGRA